MCSKVRFLTRSYAKKQLTRGFGPQSGMNVYLCECGWWHFGHATAKQKKGWRIRDRQRV